MKMILSALQASKLDHEPDYKPVIQFYEDHVQVVLYNKDKKTVLDPVTGKVSSEIDTFLYDPRVLQLGYLKTAGESIDLTTEKFIVGGASSDGGSLAEAGSELETNTNLNSLFPKSKKRFANGPVPLTTLTDEPDFGFSDFSSLPDYLTEDELSYALKNGPLFKNTAVASVAGVSQFDVNGRTVHLFKNKEVREKYEALLSTELPEDAVSKTREEALTTYFKSDEFKLASNYFQNPEKVASMNTDDIEKMLFAVDSLKEVMSELYHKRFREDLGGIFPQSPNEEKIFSIFADFSNRVGKNPEPVLRALSNLPDKEREITYSRVHLPSGRSFSRDLRFGFIENALSQPIGVFEPVAEKNIMLSSGARTPSKWRESVLQYIAQNVEIDTKNKRKQEFDVSFLEEKAQTPRGSGMTEQFTSDEGTIPLPPPSPKIAEKVKKSKKIKFSPINYLEIIRGFPDEMQYILMNESLYNQIYSTKDAEVIKTLNVQIKELPLNFSDDQIKRFFPKTPRIYDDINGNKIPFQIAKARYLDLKNQYKIRNKKRVETGNLMATSVREKYSNVEGYYKALEEELKKNGVSLNDPEVKEKADPSFQELLIE